MRPEWEIPDRDTKGDTIPMTDIFKNEIELES